LAPEVIDEIKNQNYKPVIFDKTEHLAKLRENICKFDKMKFA